MGAWVWFSIGFGVGIVVVAIIRLFFHKDPTAELEQAADDRGAQLSKAEMKTAVLQEKLFESETAREEQAETSEAACQAQLAQAEANYQRKLDTLEKQFADLEASFAAQLAAKEEEKLAAAGVAAGLVAASTIAHDEPEVDEPPVEFGASAVDEELDAYVSELEEIETFVAADPAAAQFEQEEEAADGLDLADAALMATGAAAVAALAGDDTDEAEPDAAEEAEDDAVEQDIEAAADEPAGDAADAVMVEEGYDDGQTAVDEPIDDESADDEAGAGLAAKAAVAVGGAAIAAAVLSDEPDDEEEETELAAETVDAEEALIEDSDDPMQETAGLDQEAEAFNEEAVEVEGEADEDEGHAAAVAAALAGGTSAAALAAAGDDEVDATEENIEQLDETEELQEETAVPDSDDGPDEEPFDEPQTDDDELAGAGAAVLGAAALAESVDEETEGEEEEPAPPPWPEDTSTWQGEYFNNMKLEGEPVLVREDAEIDFDWGMDSPAPEVNVDGFSARWTRTANLPPGLYRFTVTSDDGARLWVNDRMVISAWYDHTEMTFRREMELPGGPVELRLEYYENAMAALIRVSWERIG